MVWFCWSLYPPLGGCHCVILYDVRPKYTLLKCTTSCGKSNAPPPSPQTVFYTHFAQRSTSYWDVWLCENIGLGGWEEKDPPELGAYRGRWQALSCQPWWMDTGVRRLCHVHEEKHHAPPINGDLQTPSAWCTCAYYWDLVCSASSGDQFFPITSTIHQVIFPHLFYWL